MADAGDTKKAGGISANKWLVIAIVAVVVIGAGAWYYFSQTHRTDIDKIVGNPGAYAGKEVAIEGEVTDRTALFGALKFYKIKDKSGEMIVVSKRSLPEMRSNVGVKGRIDEAFSLGDQKLVVFVEGTVVKKEKSK
jgi:aspartyl/asparaginyl-tRNA synthetase